MRGELRLLDDGWELKDPDGNIIDSGSYPLRETTGFIESAAEALDHWQYHKKPYERVDERRSDQS